MVRSSASVPSIGPTRAFKSIRSRATRARVSPECANPATPPFAPGPGCGAASAGARKWAVVVVGKSGLPQRAAASRGQASPLVG
jgi:hypothetical protein